MTEANQEPERLGVSEQVFLNNPIIREAMTKTIAARPARDDDDPADVLILGRDFHYLMVSDGEIAKANPSARNIGPDRVIIDADSFLTGLHSQFRSLHSIPAKGFMLIGIRTDDNSLFRIDPTS